jgi:hypothetical protein
MIVVNVFNIEIIIEGYKNLISKYETKIANLLIKLNCCNFMTY